VVVAPAVAAPPAASSPSALAAPLALAGPPAVPARHEVAAPAVGVPRRTLAAASESVVAADGASELFGAAERARREGDLSEARHLYGRLAARFPGTREELAARVLRGQMLLDQLDDANGALGSFEHYLRDAPTGTLAEEALVGRAQALRSLGRARAEAAAWRDLLAFYPRSVHAELARERLAALVGAP
jgi:TolA-binding protein